MKKQIEIQNAMMANQLIASSDGDELLGRRAMTNGERHSDKQYKLRNLNLFENRLRPDLD